MEFDFELFKAHVENMSPEDRDAMVAELCLAVDNIHTAVALAALLPEFPQVLVTKDDGALH